MRVLVTGGTGFVGAYATARFLEAGHEVRLLVRDPRRLSGVAAALGLHDLDYAVGDVADEAAVRDALGGCDGVLHAAGMVTFDPRRAAEARRANVDGVGIVLGTAADMGLDPIIYVSTVSALLPSARPVLAPDADVTGGGSVYGTTKAEGERAARRLQSDGAPIVITYPGGIWGPKDVNLGEQTRGVITLAKSRMAPDARGGYLVVDVRDLAASFEAMLVPGEGPRRYMLGGTWLDGRAFAETFAGVVGHRIMRVAVPPAVLLAAGRLGDAFNAVARTRSVVTTEGMQMVIQTKPSDDSAALADLPVERRPVEVTMVDTLRWLYEVGHLRARDVGSVALAR